MSNSNTPAATPPGSLPALENPRSLELLKKWPAPRDLITAHSPAYINAAEDNFKAAVLAGSPSVILTLSTYGERPLQAILASLIGHSMTLLSDSADSDCLSEHIAMAAASLLRSPKVRLLSMVGLLRFFSRLNSGAIDFDGWLTVPKIVRLLNAYAVATRREEARLRARAALPPPPTGSYNWWRDSCRKFGLDPDRATVAEWLAAGRDTDHAATTTRQEDNLIP